MLRGSAARSMPPAPPRASACSPTRCSSSVAAPTATTALLAATAAQTSLAELTKDLAGVKSEYAKMQSQYTELQKGFDAIKQVVQSANASLIEIQQTRDDVEEMGETINATSAAFLEDIEEAQEGMRHNATAIQHDIEAAVEAAQGNIAASTKQCVGNATAAVEELLRWDSPLQMFERWVLDDGVEIAGQEIGVGQEVAMLFGAAQRDPRRFDDPDRFDIGRNDAAHIGFGGGIHFCVGAPLARLELAASIAGLVKRFPDLTLAEEPRYHPTFVIRGLTELRLARQ